MVCLFSSCCWVFIFMLLLLTKFLKSGLYGRMKLLLIVQILFQWLIILDDCVVTSVIVIFSCQEFIVL